MNDWVNINEYVVLWGSDSLTDDQLAAYLDLVHPKVTIALIDTCFSGGFIEDLSAPNRIIITETTEENYGIHMSEFIDVLHGRNSNIYGYKIYIPIYMPMDLDYGDADLNKDGKVSIAEAFNYASKIESERNLAFHITYPFSQYDDNGDGIAHIYPLPKGGDGALGERTYLIKKVAPVATFYVDQTSCNSNGYCPGFYIKTKGTKISNVWFHKLTQKDGEKLTDIWHNCPYFLLKKGNDISIYPKSEASRYGVDTGPVYFFSNYPLCLWTTNNTIYIATDLGNEYWLKTTGNKYTQLKPAKVVIGLEFNTPQSDLWSDFIKSISSFQPITFKKKTGTIKTGKEIAL